MSQESISVYIELKPLTFDFCLNQPEVKTEQTYYTIYKTTNLLKEDGDQYQFYIGQHKQHDNLDFDGYFGSSNFLKDQIKEYGKENFQREYLEICSSEKEMDLREVYWIATTSANCIKYPDCGGMNRSNGGEFYIGNSMKGENHPMYGKHHTEESRKKSIESHKNAPKGKNHPMYGRHQSEETRRKISENHNKLQSGETHPMYGVAHTEESKQKMKEINIGKHHLPESKLKISDKNKESNSPLNIYEYILSNGEDYWKFFDKKDRKNINLKFYRSKKDVVNYKNIDITRIAKNEIEYTYILSNGEDFNTYFTNRQKILISKKFIKYNKNLIKHAGIFIERIEIKEKIKNKNINFLEDEKFSKYIYTLSNGEDYWEFFDKKKRDYIRHKFSDSKSNTIIYKGITITRVLKDKGENQNG